MCLWLFCVCGPQDGLTSCSSFTHPGQVPQWYQGMLLFVWSLNISI